MRFYAAVLLLSLPAALNAAEPAPTLRYAGTLFDAQGRPLDGSYLLHFRIFDDAAGGTPSWSESRYVRAQGGRFSALLGGSQRLPESVLRGSYRLIVEPPRGMGWAAFADGQPSLDRPGAAPAQAAAAPQPPAPTVPRVPLSRAVRSELEQARAEADRARKESEENKRRLDALEKAMGTAPAAAPGPSIYVTQKGDTLRTVAFKRLGDERFWILVYQANSDRLQRAGELTPGQKLIIPALPK